MSTARVAMVVKRSKLDRYMDHPASRLPQLLADGDPTVKHIQDAHDEHTATVAEVTGALEEAGVEVTRYRLKRTRDELEGYDLVVTVGGDGTLLHASHCVGATPVLAVNSAPSYSVGFFCGARKGGVNKALRAALRGTAKSAMLTRMQVSLNGDVVSSRVLNDALYCHRSPAATSRYIVELGDVVEEQKSSGFWLGPSAGSTAAQRSAGGQVLPLSSKNLQLVVREPYTPHGEPYKLSHSLVKPGQRLLVRAKSREMRMYLDGPNHVVKMTLGDVAEFCEAPHPLHLLGIGVRRKWLVPQQS
jgi:NAD+ kinase